MPEWQDELAFRLLVGRGTESQAQLAARAGISDRTIGLIEQKKLKKPPRPITLAKLAMATGNDPIEWLACIGQSLSLSEIEVLRAKIKSKTQGPQELTDEIKRQIREYVLQIMSGLLNEVIAGHSREMQKLQDFCRIIVEPKDWRA